MSRIKPYPMPLDEMIDREEIRELSGCTHNQMVYLTKYRLNSFPSPCHRGANRKLFYVKAEMIEWLSKNSIQDICRKRNVEVLAVNRIHTSFDNELAVNFIAKIGVMTMARLAAKRSGRRPKTTVVHLVERDDHIPLRMGGYL